MQTKPEAGRRTMLQIMSKAIVAVLLCAFVSGEEPGLVLRLEQTGLNYVKDVGLKLLAEQASKIVIPAINHWGATGAMAAPQTILNGVSGSKMDGLVDSSGLKYNLTGIKIVSLSAPSDQASLTTIPGMGMFLQAKDISIDISMNFAVKYGFLADHGHVTVKVSGVQLLAGIQTTITKDGHLDIRTSTCGIHVGSTSIHFSGSLVNELLNILDPIIDAEAKSLLNSEVCGLVNSLIQTQVVKLLDAVPVNARLMLNFFADFALTSPPQFGTNYAAIFVRGEVYILGYQNNSVVAPPPAPFTPANNSMISIAITDYVFNSVGFVIGKLLPITVNAALLNQFGLGKMSAYLKTTCDPGVLCIGAMIPQFGTYYPNSTVDVAVGITSPPTISVDSSGLHVDLPLNISMTAESDTSGTPSITFTVDQRLLIAGLKLNPEANGTYSVSGELSSEGVDVSLIDTKLPGLTAFALKLFMALVNREGIPILNNMFEQGIQIPQIKQLAMIEIQDPLIQYYDKTLVFSTRFQYLA